MNYDLFSSPTDGRQSLLWNLVRIASPTGDVHALADYLHQYMLAQGLDVNRSGDNMWLMPAGYDTKKQTVLLAAPLDTQDLRGRWLYDPYEAEIREGRMYGMGVCRKANIVLMLEAFSQLSTEVLPYNLIVALVADTRTTDAQGVSSLLALLPPVHLSWLFWPTDGMAPTSEYGRMDFAVSHQGEQAVSSILDDIQVLRNGWNTLEVKAIEGRGHYAKACFSLRLDVDADVEKLPQEIAKQVKGQIEETTILPATRCYAMGLPVSQETGDTTILSQLSGKRVKWGLGKEKVTDEWMQLSDMESGIAVVMKALRR